ncbi:MAG TPA: ATP-binding protein, partial [Bryobacteraceae bacterium]|nr:ATP-binding protein [Bryobacteraceae bacterium]
PFSDPSGKRYVGGVGVDVTSQKCLEERIGEAQRLESLGVLAGGIAHTFNNLLTVVLGNASLAKDVCPSSQELDSILAAAERAAELTRQLTAYAGAERSSPRELRLSNLAAEITELLRASVPPNVELQLHLAADPYCVVADPAQIQQILVSLVTNAAEAIEPPRTGVITVKNGVRHLAASQHGLQPGNYVTIAVSDTGRGMSAETVARVFDPFFTTKFAGRGLGLAAVAGIVRTLGGAIAVESAEGQGSTFTVLLPALPPEHACEPPRPAAGTLPQVTMTE